MDMQKVGNYIQNPRKQLNISQSALGEYLFVTDKAVSKWETGLDCSKKFVLPDARELIRSDLYSSEDVVPNPAFDKSTLPVAKENNSPEITLPEHSVALLQFKFPDMT